LKRKLSRDIDSEKNLWDEYMFVNFDLSELSSDVIQILRERSLDTFEGPFATALHHWMVEEQIRRVRLRAGESPAPIEMILPLMSRRAMENCAVDLAGAKDGLDLAAELAEPRHPEHSRALKAAPRFFTAIAQAMFDQLAAERAPVN